MRKFRLFVLTFVLVLCGSILFTGCKEEDEPKIIAVDPTVNVYVVNGNMFTTDNFLMDANITTSSGDTAGVVVWETPTAKIQLGENYYRWVFTPEDTLRYKTATGTIKLTGHEAYELGLDMSDWTYGETPSVPSITGYTGGEEDISIEYQYCDEEGNVITEDLSNLDAGRYSVKATVTILDTFEVNVFKSFEIKPIHITEFELSIDDWSYGSSSKTPTVSDDLSDKVKFYYSTSENGVYTQTVPTNAGTYYVKAEIFGNNNYYGVSEAVEFKIKKISRAGIKVLVESINYGETFVPAKVDANNLGNVVYQYAKANSEDWSVNLPVDAGEYKVKAIIPETNNYKETEIIKTFTINSIELDAVISNIDSTTYTGNSQVPTVFIDDYVLNKDYSLSWQYKNLSANDSDYVALDMSANNFVLAGYYKVTAVGKNNYYGTLDSVIYKIDAADLEGTIASIEPTTYTGESQQPTITIAGLRNGIDYSLSYQYKKIDDDDSEYAELDLAANNFKNAGVYKIVANGIYNYVGSISGTYTINKASEKEHPAIADVEFEEDLTVVSIDLEEGWVWDTQDVDYNKPLEVGQNTRKAIYVDDNYFVELDININVLDPTIATVTDVDGFINAIADNKIATINVEENITLEEDQKIDTAKTIAVNNGVELKLAKDTTLTVVDNVVISGTFVKEGILVLETANISSLSANVDKIVLSENLENTELTFSATEDLECEIDLNDKTLTNVKVVINHTSENTLNLTIKNGTISSETNGIEINSNDNGTIKLEYLTVSATNYALYVDNNYNGANVSTTDCSFEGTEIGAVLLANNSYSFTNTNFTGGNGIYVNAGNVSIIGGMITATGELAEPQEELSGAGYAILIDSSNGSSEAITIIVDGASFVSENSVMVKEISLGEGESCEVNITLSADDLTEGNIEKSNANVTLNNTEL